MRPTILAALVAAALLAAGCGSDKADKSATKPAATATATDSIRIKDFLFDPDPAKVKAGQAISVRNDDDAPHTLTQEGDSPSFDSGTIKGHKRASLTFSEPGTYKYFCEFHATMKGTVTVTQ